MNPHRIIFTMVVCVLYFLSSTKEMIPDISSLLRQAQFSVPNLQEESNRTFENDTILSLLHTIFIKETIEEANKIITNENLTVSPKCLSDVKKYIIRENLDKEDEDYAYYYLQKFVWDSSKNKNFLH